MRTYILLLAILKTATEVSCMLNCIGAGKKSEKCPDTVKHCKWKIMGGNKEQMCGKPEDLLKPVAPKTAVCMEMNDGSFVCHCTEANCNGDCKPGACTDLPMMTTPKMMKNHTTMNTATMMTKPTVEGESRMTAEQIGKLMAVIKEAMPNAAKMCPDAECKAMTVNGQSTPGAKVSNGDGKSPGANGEATTSDSPVTKAAVHVVIGVFILIAPFFN